MLQYGMRQTAEVVNQLISVERIMTYTKLDQEGPFDSTEGGQNRNCLEILPNKFLHEF